MTREEILSLPAGPELDALVAEKVMGICLHKEGFEETNKPGWFICKSHCKQESGRRFPPWLRAVITADPLDYSTDISCAWEVVEKFQKGWLFNLNQDNDTGWNCIIADIGQNRPHRYGEAEAPTAPLAICRASLLSTLEEK